MDAPVTASDDTRRQSASPPPAPPSSTPPPALPSLRVMLVNAQANGEEQTRWDNNATATAEEVAAPARLLCHMSIAALVDDKTHSHGNDEARDIEIDSGSESGSSSSSTSLSSSDSETAHAPASSRTPLTSITQETLHRRRMLLKRPQSSLGPHAYSDEDNDDSSDSDVEETEWQSPLETPLAPPPPSTSKHRKTTITTQQQRMTTTKIKTKRKTRSKVKATSNAYGTMVVYQPTCLDHHNDGHQENRARLSALCGPHGILHKPRFRTLRWANLRELKPARLSDMLRVHSYQYIHHLQQMCDSLPPQTKACSVGTLYHDNEEDKITTKNKIKNKNNKRTSDGDDDLEEEEEENDDHAVLRPNEWMQTKHAQKCYAVENPPSSGHFDNDSPISRSSYVAARLAAGAVCHAIDQVLQGETRNAFVVVRPPGHHAGPNGCVESQGFHRRPEMCTCGFCLLNNVAIGAAYAMTRYADANHYSRTATTKTNTKTTTASGPVIQRVAIIDFDIHHGNGTEEILRNLVPHQQNYPLPSSWAPLAFPSYKPWRDEHDVDNVFFASIHLHDGDNFYPCSGKGPQGDSPQLQQQPNILNLPLDFIGPRYLEDREKLTVKAKTSLMDRASRAFRDRITTRLVPALRAFQPDLVLLSAGFDGHADDFYYFLTEDDYEWATEQFAAVAEECCEGRLVSVLEGGYNVELSAQQKRKLKLINKNKSKNKTTNSVGRKNETGKRSGYSSALSSPAASPARSTRTEGEDEDDDDAQDDDEEEEDQVDEAAEREEEKLVYGSLARSCAAHVAALQRAGAVK